LADYEIFVSVQRELILRKPKKNRAWLIVNSITRFF